jgi:hypothetical protein
MADYFDPKDWDPDRITDPDEIAALLDDYYGQTDPTGQSQIDEEYYDLLPQEMQWLIEDQETFRSLVRDYLNGDITFEQLQEFELSDYGDAGTRFVDFYNEAMSLLQPADTTVEEGPTQKEITSGGQVITDKEGNSFIYYDGVRYVQDGKQWVPETADSTDIQLGGEAVVPSQTTVEDTGLDYEDYLQQVEEASLGLEPDADLMGTKDVFIQIEEDETPFFEPEQPERPEPEIPEVEEVGYEVTEPEVTFEEPAGGGGAEEAAPATEEATPAEEEAVAEEEPLSTVEVPTGQPSPVVDVERQWVYVGNGTFRNIVTGEEITIFIDPNFEDPYEEGEVYSRADTEASTDVSPVQEEPEEEPSLIEEIMTIPMPASDMVDVIIEDTVTPEPTPEPVPEPLPEPEEIVETPTTPTETPTTPTDTVVETPVETPAEGQEQAGEAGEAGTDTGQVGEGQDGEGEGEGGEGVGTGLGGVGMFSAYVPPRKTTPLELERYRPDLQPFRWQLEEPVRLFDYIDYNPLRNIR